jgi:hypothetical protein
MHDFLWKRFTGAHTSAYDAYNISRIAVSCPRYHGSATAADSPLGASYVLWESGWFLIEPRTQCSSHIAGTFRVSACDCEHCLCASSSCHGLIRCTRTCGGRGSGCCKVGIRIPQACSPHFPNAGPTSNRPSFYGCIRVTRFRGGPGSGCRRVADRPSRERSI